MLYEYNELQNLDYNGTKIPLSRYLYKYLNRRKEVKKLKTHEKDFLFHNMSMLRNEKNELKFDLTTIQEASEYYFNRLNLTYYENLNFDKPTRNHFNRIIDKTVMNADKDYFDNFYDDWVSKLETKKGKYLSVIHTELHRRLKDIQTSYSSGNIDEIQSDYQTKKLYSTAFFIYYKVKLFFDGKTDKYVTLNVSGYDIIINIYSFVHILFRHYFPSLDYGGSDRSINDPLPFLDINHLPESVKDFLELYFEKDKRPLDTSREYLLFSFNGDRYIIWIKYKYLDELDGAGFEFRTFYKCYEQRDLDKFEGLTEHPVDSEMSFYF
ncbi:MAG: hypothetical protein N4A49_05980 [Marinifilaceae bacterium]|jgi:hypothetical protein|nr:hypothetical protein [Marinifilaceae bacterium]